MFFPFLDPGYRLTYKLLIKGYDMSHSMKKVRDAAKRARQEAEQLFKRLFTTVRRYSIDATRIIYAKRFRTGECVIAATIPINDKNIALVHAVAQTHMKYHHEPRVINGLLGPRLRVAWRFKEIHPEERERLQHYAAELAKWAEEVFGDPALIATFSGMIAMRYALRLG